MDSFLSSATSSYTKPLQTSSSPDFMKKKDIVINKSTKNNILKFTNKLFLIILTPNNGRERNRVDLCWSQKHEEK